MFRRTVDFLLGTFLVAALLPLVFLSALVGLVRFRWRVRAQRRNCPRATTLTANPVADEFQFERAIEAYEDLIDTVLAEVRR